MAESRTQSEDITKELEHQGTRRGRSLGKLGAEGPDAIRQ